MARRANCMLGCKTPGQPALELALSGIIDAVPCAAVYRLRLAESGASLHHRRGSSEHPGQFANVPGSASEEIRSFIEQLAEQGFVGYEDERAQ
mgnify:CR=1 FL=1